MSRAGRGERAVPLPPAAARPGGEPQGARPSAPRPRTRARLGRRRALLLAAAALTLLACGLPGPLAALTRGPSLEDERASAVGCPDHLDAPGHPGLVLRVDKTHFRLAAYRDGAPAPDADGQWCWPVALGASPAGDKRAQGDERTPEGWLRVTHRNPNSSFHLSLGLNYPGERHALAAFAEGRISAAERDRVVTADRARRPAPGNTPLGGDIYIHGGGALVPWWTDGCIAVDDDVIEHLYAVAGPGTEVLVVP